MKINKNTITFDKKDEIFFDYPFITDDHMLIKLDAIFCFKFKFFSDEMTAAFVNRERFSFQWGKFVKGSDVWVPDFIAVFSQYDGSKCLPVERQPLTWDGTCLFMSEDGRIKVWVADSLAPLLGNEARTESDCSPFFALIGGEPAVIVMPMRQVKADLLDHIMAFKPK